ncbi:MAG TPA: endonuclease [Bacteroidales bacterium]|nr:endonuclease [Bacteroidales bacterium]
MIRKNKYFIILTAIIAIIIAGGKNIETTPGSQGKTVHLLFYNTENLFDTIDSNLDDDEFVPLSDRRWNTYKYYRKINNIFKVIALCSSDMITPDIIGLCEVENINVLDDLCNKTMLSREGYDYIISGGKDLRGINTALLFKKDRYDLLSADSWCPVYRDGKYMDTRAVLYTSFRTGDDTLDIIICHWPSRRGGANESEYRRKKVASYIKRKIDSIGTERKTVIMGDFNDEPGSESVRVTLGAAAENEMKNHNILVNTSFIPTKGMGTYKYQGSWYLFDQVIVSGSIYGSQRGLYYKKGSFRIVNDDALLTADNTFKGLRPYSTWWGYKYTGGFSDHLPVIISLATR